MLKTFRIGVAPAVLAGAPLAFDQGVSFAGTWKLNLAKSQRAGQTFTIDQTGRAGVMHFDTAGFGYDVDLTGKEYPAPDGSTEAWRAIDPATWEATVRAKGKVMAAYRFHLTGNTLSPVMKGNGPDGTAVEQTATLSRVSGGPGFLGKWKSTEVKGAATTLELATDGTSGITIRYPEFQLACNERQ